MAFFSVKLKDPKVFLKLEENIKRDINDILGTQALLDEVGEFAADRIRYQARIKKPINKDNAFPELKPSTVANRRYLAKHNVTHDTFQENRSNLTITGQFLDSIMHKIRGRGLIELIFDGVHQGYKSGTGNRGKNISNKKLAGYLSEKGFDVFDESLKTNERFISRIKNITLGFIRRGLAVRRKLS